MALEPGQAAGAQPWHVSRGGSRTAGAACPGAERVEEAVCPPLASFRASPQTCSGWMRDEPLGSPCLQFLGCAPALPCARCNARLRHRWVPSLGVGAGAAHPAQGQRPPAGTETAFRQLADSNWLGCCPLKVSPQEMVQEIHQVLMDREDTCHRTCFSLQLDGNVLDNFAELKTIEGLQEGSLLKVVEGKFLQTPGGNKQGVVLATWQQFPVVLF